MGGNPKSVTIQDARGNGASFRVTRHQAERKVVLSQWRGGVCVASTPIELGDIPALIGILADALGDAVVESVARTQAVARAQSVVRAQAAGRAQVARPPEVWSAKRGLLRERDEDGRGWLGVGGRGSRQGQGRLAPASLRRSSERAWATLQGRMRPAWAEITHLRPAPDGSVAGEGAPTGPVSGRPFPSGASG